jgi:hypothetical protein
MKVALQLLCVALLVSAGVACTLVAEVDRSKIGAGGEGGQQSSEE